MITTLTLPKNAVTYYISHIQLIVGFKVAIISMKWKYHKVASSNTSRLEAHTGFFRLLMKWIFDPYAFFAKKLIS